MGRRDEMAAAGRGEEVERLVERAKDFQRELRDGGTGDANSEPGEACSRERNDAGPHVSGKRLK